MKTFYDIMINKCYIFPVMFSIFMFIAGFDCYSPYAPNIPIMLTLVITFLVGFHLPILSYWFALPFAFKTKCTPHFMGHLIIFESGYYIGIRNVRFDEMAGMIPYIMFFVFILIVLFGMIVLAIVNSIKQNNTITKKC